MSDPDLRCSRCCLQLISGGGSGHRLGTGIAAPECLAPLFRPSRTVCKLGGPGRIHAVDGRVESHKLGHGSLVVVG